MAKPFQDAVILLGDSLTSRQEVPNSLHARFSDAYRRNFDVLNRGFGGYNSSWVLELMGHIFAKKEDAHLYPNVRLVTVWLGTNDSAMDKKHVPLAQFRQNIETILHLLTSPASPYAIAHSKVPVSIFLISPSGIEDSMRDDPHHVSAAATKEYVDAVLEIGDRWVKKREKTDNWKIGTVDLYGAILKAGEQGGTRRFYTDGVHLSTAGYDVLCGMLNTMIHTGFRRRGINWDDPQDCPMTAPEWKDFVDHGPARLHELVIKKP